MVVCVVTCLLVKVMRERWKTWRSVWFPFRHQLLPAWWGLFYGAEKQTASLSNYEYLAPVTLRLRSALYGLFLKGWRHAEVLIKMCVKCVFVSSVLQQLGKERTSTFEESASQTLRSGLVILNSHRDVTQKGVAVFKIRHLKSWLWRLIGSLRDRSSGRNHKVMPCVLWWLNSLKWHMGNHSTPRFRIPAVAAILKDVMSSVFYGAMQLWHLNSECFTGTVRLKIANCLQRTEYLQ